MNIAKPATKAIKYIEFDSQNIHTHKKLVKHVEEDFQSRKPSVNYPYCFDLLFQSNPFGTEQQKNLQKCK